MVQNTTVHCKEEFGSCNSNNKKNIDAEARLDKSSQHSLTKITKIKGANKRMKFRADTKYPGKAKLVLD